MTNHEIHEPKDFNEDLRKLQTSDPAHADTFNPLFERLINNDVFLKNLTERLIREHTHSGADGDGSKIPLDNIDVPTGLGGILTAKELAEHVNERNPHGTRAVDVGAASAQEFTTHKADDATTSKKGHVQVGSNVNVSNGVISVPNASTSTRGAVQLSTSTTSTSTTLAATPSAVRLAMNRANEAFTSASNGKTLVGNAITGVDGNVVIPTNPTFQQLASAIESITTRPYYPDVYPWFPEPETTAYIPNVSTLRYAHHRAIGIIINGNFHTLGGNNVSGSTVSSHLSRHQRYNKTTNTWTTLASMPGGRSNIKNSRALVGNELYVIGGSSSGGASSTNFCYNVTTNTWTSKANMPQSKYSLYAEEVKGKIYCMVGRPNNTSHRYDIETDTWTTIANSVSHVNPTNASFTIGDMIYIIHSGKMYSYDTVNDVFEEVRRDSEYPQDAIISEGYIYLIRSGSGNTTTISRVSVSAFLNSDFTDYKVYETRSVYGGEAYSMEHLGGNKFLIYIAGGTNSSSGSTNNKFILIDDRFE